MNFAGPIDAKSLNDSPVSLDGEGFSFGAKPGFVQHRPSDSHVVVPDSHLLFSGDYTRIGSDLIISNADHKFVVGNYFKGESRPALTSNDGATLSGQIVDALTGHVHYAQAAAAPAAAQVIGHVLKMSGSATAIRNGVSVELHIGDAVQKGDVIQTASDSSVGMTFLDGSAFGMTSNARMVLNEMIFDPNGSSNSSLISLVQGTITFVAGQTAKNGNMRVETPVATMGIRGTAVLVEIAANDGPTKFSVLLEPDGHTGSFNLYDKTTGQLIGTVSQAGQVTLVSSLGIGQPPTAIEQLKTLQDQEQAKSIINQVFQLYFPNFNPDNSNPKTQKFGSSSYNNLADITFNTITTNQQTFLTQIELRFAFTDPLTGITTYQNRIFYNTKAQFSALPVFANQAFVPTTETFKFMDVVKIDDPDIGNAPFYDIGVPFVAGSAIITSAVSTIGYLTESFLKPLLHINQTTGVVSFDREQFDFLDDGQTVTFMIQVTATSGPDTGTVTVPVTITGANDAPTIVVGAATIITGGVKEDTHVSPAGEIATAGTITFQDVDLTDTHTATVALKSTASVLPGFIANTTKIGTFTIDPASESNTDLSNLGSVGWHFTLDDNDHTLQSLAEGQTITQVYTITIKDSHGVPVTQDVTITITGTNDAPVLSADTTAVHQAAEIVNSTNSAVEDVVAGSLTFIDVDLTDTHQASAALHPGASSVVWSGDPGSGIPSATLAALGTAMTAVISTGVGSSTPGVTNPDSTGTGSGSLTWEFKLPDHLFDFLGHSETLTLIYDVTVADYNNGVATGTYSTQQVTVQITANNDKPVITAIDGNGAVQEDVNVAVGDILKDTGSVTFADADLTDTHTAQAVYATAVASSGATISAGLTAALATALTVPVAVLAAGTHTLNWDFALDNNLVQYLAEGETITATYTINVQDNSGVAANNTSAPQTVTVVITGTNDAPVVSAVVSDPSAVEDGSTRTLDALANASDVDEGTTLSVVNVPGTLPAGVTYDAIHHTFTLDPGNAAYQHLAEGATTTVTVNYGVSDGIVTTPTPASVSWTITGTNDAPVVSGTVSDLLVVEDGSGSVLNALANASDVDDGATLSVVNVPGTLPAGVTYDAIHHTFTLDPGNAAYQHLAEGATTTVTVNYGVSDGIVTTPTPASVSWTITGTNDAPVVSGTVSDLLLVEDGAGSVLNALANASDVDDGATLSVVNVPGTLPAGVTYDAVHHTFTLDPTNAAYQHLAEGATTTVTVNYGVSDGIVTTPTPASVSWMITGTNDAPVVSAALTDTASEGAAAFTKNLLIGASDADDGETATLHLTHVTYKVDSAAASATIPAGLSLGTDGHTLTIDPTDASFNHLAVGQHTTIVVAYDVTDAQGATVPQTETITINGSNDAPVISVANVSVTPHTNGTATISGLSVSDVDDGGAGQFTVASVADHGTVAPAGGTDTLSAINTALQTGVLYTPTDTSPIGHVTLTVTDGGGASDAVNFVFRQSGSSPLNLTETANVKDVLIGGSGADHFVFSANSGQDTVMNFTHGADKIDFQALTSIDTTALTALLATADHTGGNTLLHLNGNIDTVLVKGVAALTTSDFILHA